MINCIFLSRGLPFTWIFDEVKHVIPWPGKRKRRVSLTKTQSLLPFTVIIMKPCIRINEAKLSRNLKNDKVQSLTASSDEAQTAAE